MNTPVSNEMPARSCANHHADEHHEDLRLTMSHPGPQGRVPAEPVTRQASTVVTDNHDAAFGN